MMMDHNVSKQRPIDSGGINACVSVFTDSKCMGAKRSRMILKISFHFEASWQYQAPPDEPTVPVTLLRITEAESRAHSFWKTVPG